MLEALREEHRLKLAEWAQLEERFAAATAERLREAAEWTARLAHAELADERSRALSAELRVTRRHAEGSAAEAAQSAELAAARLGEMLGELGETRGKEIVRKRFGFESEEVKRGVLRKPLRPTAT